MAVEDVRLRPMTIPAVTSTPARQIRISVPVALGLTVLAASVVHAALALRISSPWVLPDELRYSELAKSLGNGGLPRIRDEITYEYGLGYPLLLAPIWALFEDVDTAYSVAKVLNAIVLSLTAVPAYLLARRFVDERAALIAAALSVSVPSLLYAGTLMTEVALYPAFVLALLAVAVALERPTIATQAAVVGAIALASYVKALGFTLVFGLLIAVPLYHWLDTRRGSEWRDRLRAYWPTWTVLGLLVFAGLGLGWGLGRSPAEALGAYDSILGTVDVSGTPAWMLQHLAAFDLYVAVIPFAATALVIAGGFGRDADRSTRLLSALTLAVGVPLFAAVAAYSSGAGPPASGYASGAGANERAIFILAPLFFIGFVAWLRERPGPHGRVIAVALVAALLPLAIPLERFAENEVSIQAFSLVPWEGLREHGAWPVGLLACTLTLGSLLVILRRAGARDAAFIAPVVTVLIAVTLIAQSVTEGSSRWARSQAFGASSGWVDEVAGSAKVSVLWYELGGQVSAPPAGRQRIVWLNEFYNRSVDKVFELGSPLPYAVELPATPVRLEAGKVVSADGRRALLGPLVLAPCFVRVEGEPIAHDSATRATVYRVGPVVRVTTVDPGSC